MMLRLRKKIARTLNHMNRKRQEIEKNMVEEILVYLKEYPHILRQHSLV